MGAQGEALAAKLDGVSGQLAQTIEKLSDDQWKKKTSSEGWTVGVTAHHAAISYEPVAGLVMSIASGNGFPPITPEMIDQGNAQHAQEAANCTKQEALDALSKGNAAATAILRGLSDQQLGISASSVFTGGQPASAAQIAEMILIGHPQQHLASMQAAL